MTVPYVHPEVARYEQWTQRLASKYPNIANEDQKRFYSRVRTKIPRIACIEFGPDGNVNCRRGDGANDLRGFWENAALASGTGPRRRLFLLEEHDDETKAAVGLRLGIDPQLFHRHDRVALWERSNRYAGNTPSLPSLSDAGRIVVLEYSQLMHLNLKEQGFSMRCVGNERHIAASRSGDVFDGVGAVSRKISFWGQRRENEGWDALLVVDEPMRRAIVGIREKTEISKHFRDPEPFQGGYADFIKYENLQEGLETDVPPRTSLFDDLCFYYETHHHHLQLTEDPQSVTPFAQKIVASEYMLLISYHRSLLSSLGWRLSRRDSLDVFDPSWVERAWSDLQSFQRRLEDHHRNVGLAISDLQLSRKANPSSHWMDTASDFLYIEAQLERLRNQADGLLNSFTSLAGIVGTRQSLDEARSVRVLTVLGMTFLPLSLVASLLSLSGNYQPGKAKFWVYWAASIPFILLVFGSAWLAVYILRWSQSVRKAKRSRTPGRAGSRP